ncbi:MAG: hypothetical protein EOO75_10530, partial [Myxococcales bacterium]
MRPLWPVLLALLVGCKPATRPHDPSQPPADEQEETALDLNNEAKPAFGSKRRAGGGSGSGRTSGAAVTSAGSFERPVMRCGPK